MPRLMRATNVNSTTTATRRHAPGLACALLALMAGAGAALAQNPPPKPQQEAATPEAADPRAGDPGFEQARRLMQAIDSILNDTAKNRTEAKKLPSKDEFLIPPLWTETREDREKKVRDLFSSML